MQIKKLLTDDEGVSPVIGVILMVAITVILAAVIAAFVLGIGDTDDPAPSASLEYESDTSSSATAGGDIVISHDSGDSFALGDAQLNLEVDGSPSSGSSTNPDGQTLDDPVSGSGPDVQFSPGDSISLGAAGNGNSGNTVEGSSGSPTPTNTINIELVWAPGGGDAQSVFSEDTLRNVELILN